MMLAARRQLVARAALPVLQQRTMVSVNGEELFDKVLIANRGEIACRVMRSCKKLGIRTVAIFSEPDRYAMHTQMADEAFCVGPAASAQSYLNIDRIMEVINETGAQAVHPGYGFLSENHLFAEALEAKGVSFIGPKSFAITSMGDKITSKKLAADAGVNCVPGSLAVVHTDEDIKRIANEIGYPVMIKASAGGGGKGMRIAWNDDEALEGFRLSTEEARASFGDDRIFIEKFVEEPRHIEIQVIADMHGNVAALPERECSIQRRNQKVLEEAPSTFLDPETRRAMQDQAIQLAKAVDYCSAGTVEMLVDKHKNFYFLEMNTRLQVEHPVTELVAGVDLVEQMIRVAAGHKLPDDILDRNRPILGWAHEARVYAEDPTRGFLPSTGRLIEYKEPDAVAGTVRVDTGIRQGDEISMFYDPMVSKLVTHADTREEALSILEEALDNYVVKGLGNNLDFLRDVTRHPRFRSGNFTTKFIEEEYPEGFVMVKLDEEETLELASVAMTLHLADAELATWVNEDTAEDRIDSIFDTSYVVLAGDKRFRVTPFKFTEDAPIEGPSLSITDMDTGKSTFLAVDGFEHETGGTLVRAHLQRAELKGDDTDALMEAFDDAVDNSEAKPIVAQVMDRGTVGYKLKYHGSVQDVRVLSEREYELSAHMLEKPEVDWGKYLLSPMPGSLVSVAVKEGDHVFPGQELAVVEAMKMQNVLRAEREGTVLKVYHEAGATLAVDEEIIEFE